MEPMAAHIRSLSLQQGAGEIRIIDHMPNTRRALAIAEYAREHGRLDELRDAAMTGYWRDGLGLEDDDDLRIIVERAGLDPDEALAARYDPAFLSKVNDLRAEANGAGVTGIPTFLFSSDVVVVGAQPYEELARAAEEAGAVRRSPS